ncbi:rhodanese-like domain-containing protein [Polycladomyces sp. WAk]|uniref:Rhodanese-like domain-containing protein n=1 Tax=Polycladomyces zharkentensis TaxID=2807616 RepID=A0ABS2WJ75_9BACL|nr:rhodanese-like domain-containing protein [Polycladomyces sp. WAk]
MPEVTPRETRTILARKKDRIGVLDVRKAEEWTKGHIPGAIHIPLDELPLRLGELDPNREWIVVCRSGNRSAKACAYLAERGFRVRNMRGGMLAWNETDGKGGSE